jgi:CubicO group peptidase (beta-lactamase class C family)
VSFVRRGLVAAFCGAAALLPCYAATPQKTAVIELNTYVEQAHQAGVFNGVILIADHGKVILRRALGYADGSRTVPLSLSDRFDIGSIGKEFDSVGVLMLVDEGKLSLTDPLSKFFPDLPSWAATVTMDDLLHYTSGLPDVDWKTVKNDGDIWRNLHALEQLNFPAGTHYTYNNNDTFLRRRVIEKVSGMSFAEFLETQEFPKAGVHDAVIDPIDGTPRTPRSFDANFKESPITVDMTGWTSLSLDDFLRWSNCISSFCLITPDSTRHIVTTRDPEWQTGLGHGEMRGDQLVHHVHDGSDHHYQALLVNDSSKGRTVIILTNQKRGNVYVMNDAIGAILDGKPYAPLSNKTK